MKQSAGRKAYQGSAKAISPRSAAWSTGFWKRTVMMVPLVKSIPGRNPPGRTSEIKPGTISTAASAPAKAAAASRQAAKSTQGIGRMT